MGRQFITCRLPPGYENHRDDPFPGSDKAAGMGCTCPVEQPWPGGNVFASDCPIHQLRRAEDA